MTEIRLPQSGMGMTDGTITRWFKSEGDHIEKGELLCEIDAAKATIEMEAPETGVLTRIIVQVDQNVPVDTVIAEIETAEGSARTEGTKNTDAEVQPPTNAAGLSESMQNPTAPKSKVQIAPRARQAAKELSVDLTLVQGTGPGGRIGVEDVQAFSAAAKADSAKASNESESTDMQQVPPVAPTEPQGEQFTERKHSMMRRTIARRLTESTQQVPHFYLKASCRIDAMLALRKEFNADAETPVSVNDLAVRAVALALREVPDANVSWGDKAMRHYSQSDVAVAVATPRGLITPIVRNADSKTVQKIAAELGDLAERARDSKLKPEEYQGGSTTVSNLGMFGIEEFTAIINPPQATIFAIGAGKQCAVVGDGQLEVATMMTVTLSIDHRAIDGAVAAQLLAAFKDLIETPKRLA